MANGGESTSLEMILNIELAGFKAFMNDFKAISKAFKPLREQMHQMGVQQKKFNQFIGNTKQKQAVQGMQRQYEALQKQLKPLAAETREALMANVKPSLTAEQTVQGLLDKQKDLTGWSKKYGQQLNANNTSLKTFGSTMNQVSRAGRGLTMQFLGLMFFGMMLQRTFAGLFKPAMAAFGIMDLWSTMLLVVFLPVIQELFPYFLKLVMYFIELDESTKLLLGTLAILGVVFGTVLMVAGQMALGLNSLLGLFLKLLPAGTNLSIGISGAFLAILAVVLIVLAGIYLAWKENFGDIRDWFEVMWAGVKQQIEGLKQIVSGVMDVVKGIFTGDFDLVSEGIKKIFNGLIDFIVGFAKQFISIIVIVGLGVFKLFVNVVNLVAQAWWKLLQKLDEWTGGWITKLLGWLLDIATFINTLTGGLLNLVSKIPGLGKLKDVSDINTSILSTVKGNVDKAGGIQNIELNQVFNISDKTEMEGMIDENNKKVVEDLFRLVNPTGG